MRWKWCFACLNTQGGFFQIVVKNLYVSRGALKRKQKGFWYLQVGAFLKQNTMNSLNSHFFSLFFVKNISCQLVILLPKETVSSFPGAAPRSPCPAMAVPAAGPVSQAGCAVPGCVCCCSVGRSRQLTQHNFSFTATRGSPCAAGKPKCLRDLPGASLLCSYCSPPCPCGPPRSPAGMSTGRWWIGE